MPISEQVMLTLEGIAHPTTGLSPNPAETLIFVLKSTLNESPTTTKTKWIAGQVRHQSF